MPDHFFDEIDRDEIDLFGDSDDFGIRDRLRAWLKYEPSPFQETVAFEKVQQERSLAASIGFTIEQHPLREGRQMVNRVTLRDARGRFVARGAQRVRDFLEQETGF